MFGAHGELIKVLIPPTGTVSIVEFTNESQAKMAFKSLAYKKFKSSLLYLEWAPLGILTNARFENESLGLAEDSPVKLAPMHADDLVSNNSVSKSCTLFVKNLNFSTTESSLHALFSSIGPIKSVSIKTKKSKEGNMLSMGYGFVEFHSLKDAEVCFTSLQVFFFFMIRTLLWTVMDFNSNIQIMFNLL